MALRATTAFNTEARINPALYPSTEGGRQEFIGAVAADGHIAGVLANSIAEFIGANTTTERSMSLIGGVPTHKAPPATTTSLTKVFEGTAEVIQRGIAMSFTQRPDPIKAILAPKVVTVKKIIVNIPKVTGGGATITPERAVANVVSTSSEAREYETARYGLDVIMNINEFHQPVVAQEELRVKLAAQRYQMDEAWIGNGYQALLEGGTSLIAAGLRNNPVKGTKRGRARRIEAAKMHANIAFTFDKDEYSIPNLMGALSWAGVNTPVGGSKPGGGVLLVPPGTNLRKFTDPSNMYFYLSGVAQGNQTIPFPLDNVRTDSMYGIKVLTHWPPVDYTDYDTENPQVRQNELMRPIAIANYYPLDTRVYDGTNWSFGITNFEAAEWHMMTIAPGALVTQLNAALAYTCGGMPQRPRLAAGANGNVTITNGARLVTALRDGVEATHATPAIPQYPIARQHAHLTNAATAVDVFVHRPFHVVMANSVIYCNKPGIETGFLALGYPKSAISVDQITEELIITLRMYQGAGLIAPENVIIMPDVQAAGNVKGHGVNLCTNPNFYVAPSEEDDDDLGGAGGHDLVYMAKLRTTKWTDVIRDPLFVALNINGPLSQVIEQNTMSAAAEDGAYPPFSEVDNTHALRAPDGTQQDFAREHELPIIPFCGTMVNVDYVRVRRNNGHLEGLDDPEFCDRLEGRQKCHSRIARTPASLSAA